jgi:hypothetical protein
MELIIFLFLLEIKCVYGFKLRTILQSLPFPRTPNLSLRCVINSGTKKEASLCRYLKSSQILLALENEQTIVQDLADKLDLTPRTIRYVCDRYQERGIKAIHDAPRTGRPPTFSSLTRVEIE